ncbi:hypothetical protein [Paraburkholderia phytofirmans]|uniref:hypothetical protein n=1 Tax=Paraburkholderia phytofirmans TaxID=261302 RepID=UPI0011DF6E17|nr:hypothetical protein [Paraburkholderia phytofirmans]
MRLYKAALACILFVFSINSFSESTYKWIELWKPRRGEFKFEFKSNSFEKMENILGSNTISILMRITTTNGKVSFVKYSVVEPDCAKGYGNLVSDSMDGSPQDSVPFVIGGGNGDSIIAEEICSLDKSASPAQ